MAAVVHMSVFFFFS